MDINNKQNNPHKTFLLGVISITFVGVFTEVGYVVYMALYS